MLMHQGIGLDRFNSLPRGRAVHALFECCCNVTWAEKIADARPFATADDLTARAAVELVALSQADLDRALDACTHERITEHSTAELVRINRRRIARMLGPAGGYPEY